MPTPVKAASFAAPAHEVKADSDAHMAPAGDNAAVTVAISADATAVGTVATAQTAATIGGTPITAIDADAAASRLSVSAGVASPAAGAGVPSSADAAAGNAAARNATSALTSSAAAAKKTGSQPSLRRVTQGGSRGSDRGAAKVSQGTAEADRHAKEDGRGTSEQVAGVALAPDSEPDLAPPGPSAASNPDVAPVPKQAPNSKRAQNPDSAPVPEQATQLQPKQATQPDPRQAAQPRQLKLSTQLEEVRHAAQPDKAQPSVLSRAVNIPMAAARKQPVLAGSLSNADEMAGADEVVIGSVPSRHPRQRLDFGERPANVRTILSLLASSPIHSAVGIQELV